jgi:purine-binding chemotaxis protein CheW
MAPDKVYLGDRAVFQFRILNAGNRPATQVAFRNVLPPGLHHTRGTTLEANLGIIEPGKAKTVKFQVVAAAVGAQVNAVEVACAEGSRASARTTVQVNEAALQLRLTCPPRCTVEHEVDFWVEVANPGTASATRTEVTVTLPKEVEFLTASVGGVYNAAGHCVVWLLRRVSPKQTWALSFKAKAEAAGEGVCRATAHAERGLRADAEVRLGIDDSAAQGDLPRQRAWAFERDEEELPPADPADAAEPPSPENSPILEKLLAAMEEEGGPPPAGSAPAARPAPGPMTAPAGEQHVVFTLAGTDYAVPISRVLEIGRPSQVTPLPNVPDWVLGLTNLRGDIISVVDLRGFLGLGQAPLGAGRMVVVRSGGEDLTTGLMVDRVKEICRLPVRPLPAPAAAVDDRVAPYLRGVAEHADRLLVFLDLDRLLLSGELRQFDRV